MDRLDRPLSPHLQVYRWQVTNTLSILHRVTGVALSAGLVVLVWWLVALASGPAYYAMVREIMTATWFKLPLTGWAFCFFYHFANGIRHLVWDVGYGFERSQIRLGGWLVLIAAVLATVVYAAIAII
jgi:succinate dehydrogenase / fumarate reductase cytochrome b subunit